MKVHLAVPALCFFALCATPILAHEENDEHGGAKHDMGKMWAESLAKGQTMAVAVIFDSHGHLFRASVKDHHVLVDHSNDVGNTFSTPVAVNPDAEAISAEGDGRPKIALGKNGEIYLSWTQLLEKPYSGNVRFSRSTDGGKTFSVPVTINDNHDVTGHRFDAMTVSPDGKIYLAWLDKRDLDAAKKRGEKYGGSSLYYTVSDNGGTSFAANIKLVDHSCDCCRIALASPPEGAPVAFWRHDYDGNVRDHALARLDGKNEMRRVSHDEWKIDACPHHGPAIAIASDNVYHLAWFDNAPKSHGLFYAQSKDTGQSFSAPLHFGDDMHKAGHPDVLSLGRNVFLVWKEFDGEVSKVEMMHSHDGGVSWSQPKSVADTHDASDHPLLAAYNGQVWLSWNTKLEGYRLIALDVAP